MVGSLRDRPDHWERRCHRHHCCTIEPPAADLPELTHLEAEILQYHALIAEAPEVHLDPVPLDIVEGVVGELIEHEVGAETPVEVAQEGRPGNEVATGVNSTPL